MGTGMQEMNMSNDMVQVIDLELEANRLGYWLEIVSEEVIEPSPGEPSVEEKLEQEFRDITLKRIKSKYSFEMHPHNIVKRVAKEAANLVRDELFNLSKEDVEYVFLLNRSLANTPSEEFVFQDDPKSLDFCISSIISHSLSHAGDCAGDLALRSKGEEVIDWRIEEYNHYSRAFDLVEDRTTSFALMIMNKLADSALNLALLAREHPWLEQEYWIDKAVIHNQEQEADHGNHPVLNRHKNDNQDRVYLFLMNSYATNWVYNDLFKKTDDIYYLKMIEGCYHHRISFLLDADSEIAIKEMRELSSLQWKLYKQSGDKRWQLEQHKTNLFLLHYGRKHFVPHYSGVIKSVNLGRKILEREMPEELSHIISNPLIIDSYFNSKKEE